MFENNRSSFDVTAMLKKVMGHSLNVIMMQQLVANQSRISVALKTSGNMSNYQMQMLHDMSVIRFMLCYAYFQSSLLDIIRAEVEIWNARYGLAFLKTTDDLLKLMSPKLIVIRPALDPFGGNRGNLHKGIELSNTVFISLCKKVIRFPIFF